MSKLTVEQIMYDEWVTSGGSDQCMQNGMWGHCGRECTVYGSKPECPELPDDDDEGEDV